MSQVKFIQGPRERAQVRRIANRYFAMLKAVGIDRPGFDRQDVEMDIAAVAAQGQYPLDMTRLERSSEFDFAHDVAGIRRHLNRSNGLLMDCFIPRAARPVTRKARNTKVKDDDSRATA